MQLEKQVCSLELAKRLKKLRVKQDGLFYWAQVKIDGEEYNDIFKGAIRAGEPMKYIASAFTVAELGEMLPTCIPNSEPLTMNHGLFGYGKTAKHRWQCMYYDVKFFNEDTEADVRAKLLIYLLEHKLIYANGGSDGQSAFKEN